MTNLHWGKRISEAGVIHYIAVPEGTPPDVVPTVVVHMWDETALVGTSRGRVEFEGQVFSTGDQRYPITVVSKLTDLLNRYTPYTFDTLQVLNSQMEASEL